MEFNTLNWEYVGFFKISAEGELKSDQYSPYDEGVAPLLELLAELIDDQDHVEDILEIRYFIARARARTLNATLCDDIICFLECEKDSCVNVERCMEFCHVLKYLHTLKAKEPVS